MYLKGKIQELEPEVQMNKTETNKSATVAAGAEKDLDTAERAAKQLSGLVTQLQRRLDRLEGLGAPPSNTTTGDALPTRPTRRRTRRHTGRRSVRQPTSGRPSLRCPRMSFPS